MPPAPGRFSTKNCCLKMLDSGSATMRPSVSAAPPGANGATILTGLVGQTCACEGLIARHKRERRTTTILIISASLCERSGSIPQIEGDTSWRQDGGPGGKRSLLAVFDLSFHQLLIRAGACILITSIHGFVLAGLARGLGGRGPQSDGTLAINPIEPPDVNVAAT